MMIADSCEAGARSLAKPDRDNVRAIATKIVDAILSDGQLDECDLTLREVTKIRDSVISSIIATYHARIDYPGFNPPPLAEPIPSTDGEKSAGPRRSNLYSKPSEVPVNKSGEVEDEAFTNSRRTER